MAMTAGGKEDNGMKQRDAVSLITEVEAIADHAIQTLRKCAAKTTDDLLRLRCGADIHDLEQVAILLKEYFGLCKQRGGVSNAEDFRLKINRKKV